MSSNMNTDKKLIGELAPSITPIMLDKAWEVILGPSFQRLTNLTPQQAIEITDKTLLKHLIDHGKSAKVVIESDEGQNLTVYVMVPPNKNHILFFVRDDMIKYKLRSAMNQLDTHGMTQK